MYDWIRVKFNLENKELGVDEANNLIFDEKWEGITNAPVEERMFKVTFKYYMNMPSLIHDKTEEVSAISSSMALSKIEEKYPNVSLVNVTEI